ncbi:tyrosine--tRNA ligase [Candidatus Desantisbacteria bacterium]|nr:tyrosine--tRNA ligase [Candidatus Desantisbacteria bacterium]
MERQRLIYGGIQLELNEQLSIINRGTVEIISEDELKAVIGKKTRLRIKFGADPTAPDIHLGHTVVFRKLKQFQELGHEVIFIIGDFTAKIGDPSGRLQTRPRLSTEEIVNNANTYQEQVFKILDREKTTVVFNSRWLEAMGMSEMMELSSRYTVARMLERDDFTKRYKEGKEITILEFLYPLLQGYDSVYLQADVEIGGTDQKFNLLVGRNLQRDYGQAPQIVITMPLLEGTDGVRKMSKSYWNYIGVKEQANDMFGKIMSIPDAIMQRYFELLTDIDIKSISNMHPKEAKKLLAREIVTFYHSRDEAIMADEGFERVFSQKGLPDEMQEICVTEAVKLVDLLAEKGLVSSKSHVRRLITQGGVRIDNERVNDVEFVINMQKERMVIQYGKRNFVRLNNKG